ncbi:BppU family phage baseplate upper protein [Bacillus subtilis]|uniref:BppU family phage baseplate upper protein n=1 Tax=Bacillus subtilis TaxID=1423 RepID=UPI002798B445|nr:BppU family phage baseplate upper protein [Bacillus subtilis]MEC2401694.1 BppU family phage baseplate upper protein [Bacillus subtilis]MED4660144.1 BppU family phage baseplate upper protein [Bacillus subtilis]MED4664449.1 BppU family phage baseplate upper protein [Bacillus subtilis]WEZ27418.1 BppU family phage baseplate upper protein [Bacillus subtilis]
MIYKDAAISANVGTSSSSRTTNIHFSTQDIGTAKLTFKVFKDGVPLPLSAVTGKLVLVMADGSKFIKNITIVDKLNGIAEYVLTREEIKHYGKVQASLNLYYDNKQSLGVTQFTFQIDQDLIDTDIVPIAEYYIEDFETLRQSVEAIVSDLQEKFKDLDNVETKAGAQEKADAVQANLDTHTRNKSNPHGVTKIQIGLGNVDNVQQASKQDFDLHVSDAVKHISTAERSKWNGAQIHKITQDDGRVIYKSATEVTDYNDLTDTGMYLIYNKGLNGPGLPYAFLLVMSSKNTLVQIAYDGYKGEQVLFRLRKNDSITWTAWVELESTVGAQKKVDAHANRKDNPHAVTKAQVGLDKVDNVQQASLAEFNAHNYNSVRHVVQADKDKWNGAQLSKITADHGGVSIAANEGEDILQKIVDQGRSMGTFYAHGKAVNAPSTYSTRGIFHLTGLSSDGKGMYGWVYATDYKNNVFTNYYDGSTTYWQGWKKLVTDVEYDSLIWQNVTLKNGASTGDRPFQYVKWGNLLLLRGHITATREVVCGTIPSDRLPANGAAVMVPVSGTTGYSKLFINASGDMKLTGIHSNNDSNVTGYYMDAVVALN